MNIFKIILGFLIGMFLTIANGAESNRIAIVVNKYLKKEIETNLEIYLEDLKNEGYETVLKEWDLENNPAPQELKAYLKGLYLGRGLQGAVFIGDLPIAIMEADPSLKEEQGIEYIQISNGYIADKYYMDLVGREWTDNDKNYKFEEPDYYSFWKVIWDNLEYYTSARMNQVRNQVSFFEALYPVPEIWLSRIVASSLTGLFKRSEGELVNAYLEKNHAYRTNQVIFPKQNLMYSLPTVLENDIAFSKSGMNQVRQILSKRYSLLEPLPGPAKVDEFFAPLNNASYAMLYWGRHGFKTSIDLGTQTLTSKMLANFPINIATAFVFPDSCLIGHYLEPEYFAGSFVFNERFYVGGMSTATLPAYVDVQAKIMENFNNDNSLGIAFKSALQIPDVWNHNATYFQSRMASLNSRYILGDGTLRLQRTDSVANENNSAKQYLERQYPYSEELLINYVSFTQTIPQEFDNTETVNLLFKTAWANMDGSMIDFLIKKGAEVKILDEEGNTLLHLALSLANRYIDPSSLQNVLKQGLDVRTKNKFGKTPWDLAKENGHDRELFNSAINSETIDQVKYLIENGADINAKDESSLTALHHAVLNGNMEMIQLVIENGSDINVKNKSGYTPSDLALVSSKGLEILSLLRQASTHQCKIK